MYKGNNGDKDNLLIDSLFNQAIAEVLKELRQERGLSLQELAKKMDNIVTRQTLNRYELGLSKLRMNVFLKFASAFNMQPKDLYEKINMRYISKLSQYIEQMKK